MVCAVDEFDYARASMTMLAARFPHLKAYLSCASHSEDALNFEQLLGFLYAVSSARDIVDASELTHFVFADGLPAGDLEAKRIIAELLELYRAIDRQVLECRVELPQECAPRPDVLSNLDPECGLSRWSQGFSAGHDWLEDAWDASVRDESDDELDWQLGGCMAVLCFFASREVAEALHEEFSTDSRSLEERAATMLSLFPDALNAYADIGRGLAAGGNEIRRGWRFAPETMTSDRCPCGSGRAFEACCRSRGSVH